MSERTTPTDALPVDPDQAREADERLAPEATDKRVAADKPHAGFDSRGKVRRTRAGAWWTGLITAAILAIALLVFIAQNSQKATIHFLGFSGQVSLAVALLSAAAGAVLLVGIPGAIRIAQLRRALKKNAS